MKILIIRTFPNEVNLNHYNIQEIGLAKALAQKGHTCGIVLYSNQQKDSIENINDLIAVYWLHGFGILKNGFFPSLGKIVKEYDVLQVHEYDQITSWYYYAFNKKKPVVIYHGPYYHSFNKGYNLKCRIFDNSFLKFKKNKNVICLTKSKLAATFLNTKGFQRCIPVGVGIDTDAFVYNNENKDKELNNNFRLLYIGKIEERRNVIFLLDILAGLLEKKVDVTLTIIGDGSREYVEKFKKKANNFLKKGIITYIPKVEQKKLNQYYLDAHLMVFPTNYDIFGMVLLETMFFSLPVVSSLNGGADMLIKNGENGFIIPELKLSNWIDTIYNIIIEKEKYRSVKQNLQNMNKENLTWNYLSNIFISAYQEAILQKR